MVMENKHMDDGDDGGDNGDEEALEIPLSEWRSGSAASENKDRDAGGSLDLVKSALLGIGFFQYIWGYVEGEAEPATEAQVVRSPFQTVPHGLVSSQVVPWWPILA
jgi:hypothetical protein